MKIEKILHYRINLSSTLETLETLETLRENVRVQRTRKEKVIKEKEPKRKL